MFIIPWVTLNIWVQKNLLTEKNKAFFFFFISYSEKKLIAAVKEGRKQLETMLLHNTKEIYGSIPTMQRK